MKSSESTIKKSPETTCRLYMNFLERAQSFSQHELKTKCDPHLPGSFPEYDRCEKEVSKQFRKKLESYLNVNNLMLFTNYNECVDSLNKQPSNNNNMGFYEIIENI